MASKGFDCATPLTEATAAAFKADGMEFVCRYLVPSGWKALTKAEVDLICAAGLQIVSVFETAADRALGGYAAGLADGATAVKVADQIGQPEGTTIYFAVDFDAASAWEFAQVVDYIRGASLATPNYRSGVYGSYDVMGVVQSAGAGSMYWQTRAWSRGQVADGIHIYQYDCGPSGLGLPMHGIQVDLNEGYGDYGGWTINQKILEADDLNELKLTTEGWGTLALSLQKAYDEGLLGDYTFVAKASSGELTRSELDVANNLIIVNGAVRS